MSDFLDIIKTLILIGGLTMIGVATAFAVKGLKKKPVIEGEDADRLHELESRLAELEERVDFTERALADVRGRGPDALLP